MRPYTSAAVLVTAALVLFSGTAHAQDQPSVSVAPADVERRAPNEGAWFVIELPPGGQGELRARLTNVSDEQQRVRLSVRDLHFGEDGEPVLAEELQLDVGLWGYVAEPEVTIPPGEVRTVTFGVRLPEDVAPGDHVGAFVAETRGTAGDLRVVKRIATRVYVTVPGDAERSFVIESIEAQTDSWLWPTGAMTKVVLRNDGRIRLAPVVTVNGVESVGARLLMTHSAEPYVADVAVPWYGGPLRLHARVQADSGLIRAASKTVWVIPWGLIILIVVAASATYAGRRWWKTRKSATAELKQDIQRLERLITQQAKAQETTAGTGAGLPPGDVPEDEEAILLAALKRARRANDDTALARIALAKHVTSGDALDLVLEALEQHDGKHRDALLDAAVGYGADALSTHERFGGLPDHTQTELGERLVTAGGTVSGNGNGEPTKIPQPVVGQTDSDGLRAALAGIKGVGPAKQEALVARFGSLDAIRAADVEELVEIPGVGYATAREILDRLDA